MSRILLELLQGRNDGHCHSEGAVFAIQNGTMPRFIMFNDIPTCTCTLPQSCSWQHHLKKDMETQAS